VLFLITVLVRFLETQKILLLSLLLWRNNGRTDSRPETNINAKAVVRRVCVCAYFALLPGDDSAALRSGPGHFSNHPFPLATLYVYYDSRVAKKKKIHSQSTKVSTI